jgi:hypothetical protein
MVGVEQICGPRSLIRFRTIIGSHASTCCTIQVMEAARQHHDPSEFLPQLRALLSSLAEVFDIRPLTSQERSEAQRLEDLAEASGAAGGLMPFVNEGIHAALASDAVFAVTTGPMTNEPSTPWTIMLDDDDQMIGEWLPQSRIAEARESKRCIFLSNDFVMYKDRRPRGRGRFVMPFVCLPIEDDTSPFTVCGVGSPSTTTSSCTRSLALAGRAAL